MKSNPICSFIKGTLESATSDFGNIEIIGGEKVIIEHTQSIMEYEKERVRLSTGKLQVVIGGFNLTLSDYSDNVMIVSGTIKNISFE